MKHPLFHVAGLTFAASAAMAQTPELTIYTYDSFVTEWGPGPAIEAAFEEVCGCDLVFSGHGDGAALLSRLRLEGNRTEADIVLGLDTNLTYAAAETGLFAPHGLSPDLDLPVSWDDPDFLPYDWGYFAFVGNEGGPAPSSFEELAQSDASIVIQDPRSSTPGLGLALWVQQVYGDEAAGLWADLADNVVTVTPGWSEAYGLFLEGEADLVLSYTTSPAYHLIAEEDASKIALRFDEGHYMQVEVAGIVASTDQPDLARQFMEFMVSDAFQSVIPTTNWMFPAVMPEGGLPEGFGTDIDPETALLLPADAAAALRESAIDAWRTGLSQ
ncbi:thiamine ABC transporter substrate binding subunit [Ponticoccus sp. SC2-23]|uniref:thiamine ABC transporter substrate binding subunit n=1 Tax=Alexandriicola marinus TaxID=2081710 RepID=UPI000FD825E6|nr:thiamine ABC transporter substrate binding subunit [Alexandriicola marinus]MBM1220597.1 thiamine ABC transporter substrate binding subunit [Ponticoccus sp. SC6-9]MBM1225283.1 thiamine ABC transporter substrate binding subunit [Ponticoccus sp. SC6-15]MBM1228797.1 thiamine ABC transporter substrate binding subunit [Ponticoccus sp. SC6-38]MBM1233566.1 thiamine ABC transporter substrate binding subunit [Ponticoccus sp. SC6-45]MBM1239298.1 thiamine ABC transporter substrate binding subunit [Pont